MVTESSVAMMSEMRMIGGGGGDGLEMLLRDQHWQDAGDREREINLYRSGSAPPTIDGSLAAIGGLFGREAIGGVTEEELRSDPAYHSYYYSHVNLNPRLPPPVLSKEDWRFTNLMLPAVHVTNITFH